MNDNSKWAFAFYLLCGVIIGTIGYDRALFQNCALVGEYGIFHKVKCEVKKEKP